jgi:hypothetical protein
MSRVEPAAALAALTHEGAAVFAMSRAFVAARIAESQNEGKLQSDLDPEQAAEILVRLGFSFLLIPQSALPVEDDERMREVARRMIAPILGEPE